MANKKETKVEEVTPQTENTPILSQEKFEQCEWCFQFDDEDPHVFAWTDEEINTDEEPRINFSISNVKDAYITFSSKSGRTFKLFPRELTEAGKQMREEAKLKINE